MTPEQDERLVSAFERIAAALEFQNEPPEEPCQHPQELVTDFGGHDEWECRCGYQSPGRVAALTAEAEALA